MYNYSPNSTISSDFSRMEDVAAAALQAGRRAASALCALPPDTALRTREVLHIVSLLTTERLFEESSLSTLDNLESQLHAAVQGQTYTTAPYGWYEAEGELTPERRLTDQGRQLERVRNNVAEAVSLARYMQDLAAAERVVGRTRGLMA